MMRRLKALFCCLRHEPRAEGAVEYDPDECDYVVEKLIVRRVPLALFAIPADFADNASRSTSSSALGGAGSVANATQEASTKLGTDRTATDETLRFADERRDSVGGRLDDRAKSLVWREGISSRFNALHPNLKKSECSLEDPLKFSRNRQSFTENISEITSSTRTDVSSQTTSSVTVQNDVPTRDDSTHGSSDPFFGFENERKSHTKSDEVKRDASSGQERDIFMSGRNRKYIVSPFRVQRGSFDLAKSKGVGDHGVDGKSLTYIEESLEDKLLESTEKDRDLGSNTAVRWRITIRPQRTNATFEHAVSEVRLEFSEKTREYLRVENCRKNELIILIFFLLKKNKIYLFVTVKDIRCLILSNNFKYSHNRLTLQIS